MSPSASLGCDNLSDLPCFDDMHGFEYGSGLFFVVCPTVWTCLTFSSFFSWLDLGSVFWRGEDPRDLGLETVLLSMFINEPKKEMTNKLMEGA